jgi:hypothetical protein
MPRYPRESILFPTQQTFPCPVQGCRTQVRSHWGFTQHVGANHPGMDLQYPGNEGKLVQFPSSDIDQTSSPPPSPNAFPQDHNEPDFQVSDWGPSDFDLDGNAEPIPADLDSSESDLGDERSVPADSTEFHPLINGMYINYIILQLLNE